MYICSLDRAIPAEDCASALTLIILDTLCTTIHSSQIVIQLKCIILVVCIHLNSVDPERLASEKPADLDLHCFQNRIYRCSAW